MPGTRLLPKPATPRSNRLSLRLLDFENHFPRTTKTVKSPLEHVLGEISREMSKANCRPDRAVFQSGPANVCYVAVKSCLTCHNLAFDCQCHEGWPASTSRCRRGPPHSSSYGPAAHASPICGDSIQNVTEATKIAADASGRLRNGARSSCESRRNYHSL